MFVLGLMGSPRLLGNTDLLLSAFLEGAQAKGAEVLKVDVAFKNIAPCQGCRFCEEQGFCRQQDDAMGEMNYLLRRADLVVLATTIFFYGPSAQLKALIDRSQALWTRRHIMKLADPKAAFRKGFLLAVGATKGKELFTGTSLTAKYFFDAIGARYEGFLGFRQMEEPGAITRHPTALVDAGKKGAELTSDLSARRRALFLCRENAGRSQMAEAFLQYYGGDRFEAQSAGDQPASEINPLAIEAMAEQGIDLAFRRPRGMDQIEGKGRPFDLIVQMGCEQGCPVTPGNRVENWELEDPAGKPLKFMRLIRDEMERRVKALIAVGA
ncbi:MAG: NAD(P)H-dependent oxidoreductase [Desulfobacterales bacterium]|nr:NAD(P)H-dependent oxidoreductase [Desulfobacterales bacterium]